jgi:UDP-N-acetylglucosamine/UDP-N-acetylgalactosamine diphosphorylase
MTQGAKWVLAAGGVVVSEGEETGVEVSPLISYVSQLSRYLFRRSRTNIDSGW